MARRRHYSSAMSTVQASRSIRHLEWSIQTLARDNISSIRVVTGRQIGEFSRLFGPRCTVWPMLAAQTHITHVQLPALAIDIVRFLQKLPARPVASIDVFCSQWSSMDFAQLGRFQALRQLTLHCESIPLLVLGVCPSLERLAVHLSGPVLFDVSGAQRVIRHRALDHFHLEGAHFDAIGCSALGHLLKMSTTLLVLALRHCQLARADPVWAGLWDSPHSTLVRLDLTGCPLDSLAQQALQRVVPHHPTLAALYGSFTDLAWTQTIINSPVMCDFYAPRYQGCSPVLRGQLMRHQRRWSTIPWHIRDHRQYPGLHQTIYATLLCLTRKTKLPLELHWYILELMYADAAYKDSGRLH